MSEDTKMKTAVYYPNPTETLGTFRKCKICNATQSKIFSKKESRWLDFEGEFKHHPDCELAAQAKELKELRITKGTGKCAECPYNPHVGQEGET